MYLLRDVHILLTYHCVEKSIMLDLRKFGDIFKKISAIEIIFIIS